MPRDWKSCSRDLQGWKRRMKWRKWKMSEMVWTFLLWQPVKHTGKWGGSRGWGGREGMAIETGIARRPKWCIYSSYIQFRETRERVAPADCWNWGKWGLKEYIERGSSSLVGLVRYKRFLSCLDCSSRSSTKKNFPNRILFYFICLYRPASWAGSCAASPVS